jgi:hypothetical protein
MKIGDVGIGGRKKIKEYEKNKSWYIRENLA